MNRDTWHLVALQIDDLNTWYSFALVCKQTSHVVRNITKQRSKNPEFYTKKFTGFFQIPVNYTPPPPPPPSSIDIKTDIFIGGAVYIGEIRRESPIIDVIPAQFSMTCGKITACNHNNCFAWGDGSKPFTTIGHKTYSVLATGRGGEGIRFNNGAEREMYSKRYNGSMTWVYKPKNPEHWGQVPPSNLAEACDRLAAKLHELNMIP